MAGIEIIRIEGLDEALARLRALPAAALRIAGEDLHRIAEDVMTDSKENYVPVVTGTLHASGFVKQPEVGADGVSVTLGFGGAAAPYALAVHENPRAGKTGGISPSGKPYDPVAKRMRGYRRGPIMALLGGKNWSGVGQWKYLETPLRAAVGRIRETLQTVAGRAFERG